MQAIQTKRIGADDTEYRAVLAHINTTMATYGFPLVEQKGSATWIAGQREPDQKREARFKLLFCGTNEPLVFGIRLDYAERHDALAKLPWPRKFGVMPQVQVPFVGFNIPLADPEKQNAIARVEKILRVIGEPDPRWAITLPDARREEEFDCELNKLDGE
jgi:hypothetical protein